MPVNKIAFVSTKGRGISRNLKMIQEYLAQRSDFRFSYYIQQGSRRNPWVQNGMELGRRAFCEEPDVVIAEDHSLPVDFRNGNCRKRILMASADDDLFQRKLELDEGKKEKRGDFKAVTHLICTSDFVREVLEEGYCLDSVTERANNTAPGTADLMNRERIKELRAYISRDYPGLGDRKILSLIIHNERSADLTDEVKRLSLNLRELLEEWGDEWFLLTNSQNLIKNLKRETLTPEICQRLGFFQQKMSSRDMVQAADVLVTNNSVYACEFAATGKPVAVFKYNQTAFEQYMEKYYKELFLENIEELERLDVNSEKFTKDWKRFVEKHSWPEIVSAEEQVLRWIE